ncbi:unnamed protein product, partial [Sphacelaria rigidula]
MAENIPFLNMMARRVVETVVSRGGTAETAMPSVMVAYSLSTIMTGAIFYLTGWFRLGQLLHFFPRHVIIGCIGGFGVFLLITAVEVSTGLTMSDMGLLKAMQALFSDFVLSPPLPPLLLRRCGRYSVNCSCHSLLTPLYMMVIPVAFYGILWFTGTDIEDARHDGWLFARPPPTHFLDMWALFDF